MKWTKRDTGLAIAITLIGGAVRFARLSSPHALIGDEGFYARDGCWYVEASARLCRTRGELSPEHPPLGKWLIGSGIRVFGFNPFGWRFAAALAGTLTVGLVYLLGKKILRSTFGASVGSGLLAIDLLHVVQSRAAMLEVFVTLFVVAAFLFWAFDRERIASQRHMPSDDPRIRGRRWRLAAGAAAGAAVACKWSGVFVLLGLAGLTLFWEMKARGEAGIGSPFRCTLREEGPSLVAAFVVLPAIIYVGSYIGRIQGPIFVAPWDRGSWARTFVARQVKGMLLFHLHLQPSPSPYASPPWSWPLLKRPMTYYFSITPTGRYSDVLATGPPVWWLSIVALFTLAVQHVRRGRRRLLGPQGVILGGFLCTYAPWLLLGYTRSLSFFFYIVPAVPFMCLAFGAVASQIKGVVGRSVVGFILVGSMGLFVFYYPVLTGSPLSYDAWHARMLFTDCGSRISVGHDKVAPNLGPGPPPRGWCWI